MERNHLVAILQLLKLYVLGLLLDTFMLLEFFNSHKRRRLDNEMRYSLNSGIPDQAAHLNDLIRGTNIECIKNLRLGKNAFARLCILLAQVDLHGTRAISIPEQVAMFFSIISHHKKNRVVNHDFKRSGRTVSIHFNNVLQAVLRLQSLLVVSPEPIQADCVDERWKWFKGCLGALDGTYIPVKVPECDKARYRSRKGLICVNVLAACDKNMNFTYVLTGWEGSGADGRLLRDAVERPNGFKVPRGTYYLCDAGYTNGEGFLAPFRSTRYHLQEFGGGTARPQSAKELFNLHHSKARNIIERAFAALKTRWAILRSHSFYRIETQNHIIMACCLLHNFMRREMTVDPIESEIPEELEIGNHNQVDYIPHVEPSPQWSAWRDDLAQEIYTAWNGGFP